MLSRLTRRQLLHGGALSLGLAWVSPLRAGADVTSTSTTAMARERLHAGTSKWQRGTAAPAGTLEPYASATSITAGQSLDVFVSSTAASIIHADVYRMGYYQGHGARLVTSLTNIAATAQPTPAPDEYNTVDCNWDKTFTIATDSTWAPGQYLVRIADAQDRHRYVPFMIRSTGPATYLYLSAVTTWQAYNAWGGYSLYREASEMGQSGVSNAKRAVRVSFNRPYSVAVGNGASDFFGNEFPLLYLLEQMGLDVAYATDIDLHENPAMLTNYRALLSLGHDEYYSREMRDGVTTAVQKGVNAVFFGANFIYRKIRFEPSFNGANRLMVNYRSTADPITATDPQDATVNWASYPANEPSSTFSGSSYGGAQGTGDLTIRNATSWFWQGAGVTEGQVLAGALGGEFNNYNDSEPNPAEVELFGHSQVAGGISDITFATTTGEGSVFCSGTGQWIYHLGTVPFIRNHSLAYPSASVSAVLRRATTNLLTRAASPS